MKLPYIIAVPIKAFSTEEKARDFLAEFNWANDAQTGATIYKIANREKITPTKKDAPPKLQQTS